MTTLDLGQHTMVMAHIHDHGYETAADVQADIDAVHLPRMSRKEAVIEWVNGGALLIYNTDVRSFLRSIGVDTDGDSVDVWNRYTNVIAEVLA